MQHIFWLAGGDHCRIGSLEINLGPNGMIGHDHCRIGSLEIRRIVNLQFSLDHCRIGSLEIEVCAGNLHDV